jgi:predicted acyl esterase
MLHLRAGEQLSLKAPTRAEPPDSYTYGGETNNTPHDWAGNSAWNTPAIAGHAISFTTPRLGRDVEFLGSGSANLWIAASAPDSDVQLTLSEIRPDGQEQYVEGGWLRLSHRKVDPRLSTALVPVHTDRQSDAQALVPGVPVLARIELEPFNHVFRASSAIRLTIDTPGKWFAAYPAGTQNSVLHALTADSTLVLGRVAGVAHDPLPACDKILNQPCRPATGSVAPGTIDLSAPPASMRSVQGHPGTAPASAR